MIAVENGAPYARTKTLWFCDHPFDVENVDSVHFLSCREKVDAEGFEREDLATIIIDLRQGEDQIWSKMNKKCQVAVKRAEKDGVSVSVNRGYDTFLELNDQFRTSKGLPPYSYSKEFMIRNGTLFTSELNGEMIGGVFFLKDEKNMLGMFAATKRLNVEKEKKTAMANANRLLYWKAIKHGLDNGLERFDFGGYYIGEPNPEMEGINEFKKRFGGTVVGDYTYWKDYTIKIKIARGAIRIANMLKI